MEAPKQEPRIQPLKTAHGLFLPVCLIALLVSARAMAVDAPSGRFDCEGQNSLGVGRYQGQVEVTATGDTYRVVWQIAGQTHEGVGFMVGDDFAVSFTNGSAGHHGLAVYARDGDAWYGRWAETGSREIGVESWTPRP